MSTDNDGYCKSCEKLADGIERLRERIESLLERIVDQEAELERQDQEIERLREDLDYTQTLMREGGEQRAKDKAEIERLNGKLSAIVAMFSNELALVQESYESHNRKPLKEQRTVRWAEENFRLQVAVERQKKQLQAIQQVLGDKP